MCRRLNWFFFSLARAIQGLGATRPRNSPSLRPPRDLPLVQPLNDLIVMPDGFFLEVRWVCLKGELHQRTCHPVRIEWAEFFERILLLCKSWLQDIVTKTQSCDCNHREKQQIVCKFVFKTTKFDLTFTIKYVKLPNRCETIPQEKWIETQVCFYRMQQLFLLRIQIINCTTNFLLSIAPET